MFLQQVSHVSRFVSRFIGKATKLGQVSQAGVKVVAIKQYLESHITTQLHGHHHITSIAQHFFSPITPKCVGVCHFSCLTLPLLGKGAEKKSPVKCLIFYRYTHIPFSHHITRALAKSGLLGLRSHRSHNTFLVTSHQSVSVCVISPV